MKREELFRRNHELFEMFMLEALDDPKLTAHIPGGASVIFLPENDPELLCPFAEMILTLLNSPPVGCTRPVTSRAVPGCVSARLTGA